MKIKVCGMKYMDNIRSLWQLPIDYMGLIFYSKSPRFAETLDASELDIIPEYIDKVGVFVDADIDYIIDKVERYKLSLVQLHGHESVSFCEELSKHVPIMKVFSVLEASDIANTKEYEKASKYFLFDTKTPQHGGSGVKFDWRILDSYDGQTPFFLSGGISQEDVESIVSIKHPMLYGLDLNSKFEIEPGVKDINLLKNFIKKVRYEQN